MTATTDMVAPQPPLARNRSFRLLWAGEGVSVLGSMTTTVIFPLVAALVVATVPLAWALGVLRLPHLVLAALGLGCCTVFFRTAYAAFVPRVVASPDLERANARIYGTESAMQIGGPGVGGLLVQAFSAAFAIVIDVVSFLASWVCRANASRRVRPGARESTCPVDAPTGARRHRDRRATSVSSPGRPAS